MPLHRRRAAVLLTAVGVVVAGSATVQAAEPVPRTVRAQTLPTMQTNGTVEAIATAAGKVFVGGSFTTVRPAGAAAGAASEVPQAYLAAYDAATGAMVADFRPVLSNTYDGSAGLVRSIEVSPDGTTVYVGGDFNSVDGAKAEHVAAFDAVTGALLPSFGSTGVNGNVYALAATQDAVYVGGTFTQAGSLSRLRSAAITPAGRTTAWAPVTSGSAATGQPAKVFALEVGPDGSSVFLGGTFDTVNGVANHGVAGVDLAGALTAFRATLPATSYVTDLAVDARHLYLTSRDDRGTTLARFEGVKALAPDTGALSWQANCYGDSFGVQPLGDVVYVATHSHNCSAIGGWPEKSPRHYASMYAVDARDGRLLPFDPMMLGSSSVPGSLDNTRAIATDGTQLFVGGGWTKVGTTAQANLTRFSPDGKGRAPLTPFATAAADSTGAVVVRWRTVEDDDDRDLTYSVYRGTTSTNPLFTARADSSFWNRTGMSYTDTAASTTTPTAYRVTVSDGLQRVFSTSTAKVVPAQPSASWLDAVQRDGAGSLWRFDDGISTTAADGAGGTKTGSYSGGVVKGRPGALTADPSTAIGLDGVDDRVTATSSTFDPAAYTLEAWVKTSSTRGGRLLGLSSSRTGTSSTYDRHLYYTDAGQLVFGVSYLGSRTVVSPTPLNDGAWHHVAATQDATGMRLYVDGALAASDPTVTDALGYTGYWKLGPDSLNGWPSKPTSAGLAADVDEVATYPVALTAEEVAAHAALR